MAEIGVHYVDQLFNGLGLDIYRDGVHVARIDNAGTMHVYYGNVAVYRGNIEIKGDAHITGSLDVKGDLYTQGNISTKNGCIIGGTLEVGGDILLHGSIIQDPGGAPPLLNTPVPPSSPLPPLQDFPNLEDKPTF